MSDYESALTKAIKEE
ncbi:unnamed protein product, partial [Rotaria magnacalcarata]